ncbi:unnamed protein product [Rotaria sp. Silwood2]|nr:unnamed protein product [Rotaria sp. Silwood2]CAF3042815.1 unnamed protein product [Rotaria sp. Silwood2]CAF3369416.1 unnamed protein product [Rotaria sp. Silwood2]CAF3408318.1 unnamed protein product [Rotaria sp. Silwood2]CAF4093895.1 unnamed protein product [Rotaria sp. Silwood2]
MATGNESSLCSICNESEGIHFCIGCNKYFCQKHLREHKKQLAIKFDDEVVRSHDELLDQIKYLEKSNYLSSDLVTQIEQWKQTTTAKVERAAEKAQHELAELIDKQQAKVTKELQSITDQIRSRQEQEMFTENDIDQLKQEIDKIKQQLENSFKKDKNQSIIIENNQINWNRLLYIGKIQGKRNIK